MYFSNYNYADDCPVCGEKDELEKYQGARMGSTAWGHAIQCCSRKCGLRYRIKLQIGSVTKSLSLFDIDEDLVIVKVNGEFGGYEMHLSKSKLALRAQINRLKRILKC